MFEHFDRGYDPMSIEFMIDQLGVCSIGLGGIFDRLEGMFDRLGGVFDRLTTSNYATTIALKQLIATLEQLQPDDRAQVAQALIQIKLQSDLKDLIKELYNIDSSKPSLPIYSKLYPGHSSVYHHKSPKFLTSHVRSTT